MSAAGTPDFQSLVLSCNKDGMDSLRKGQHKAAFEQFKYAESILIANQAEGDTTNLLAVTCNNLGCYYKKVGKLHGALSYLRRALKMEVELNTHEVTLAGTHLNICAILSKLEKHDKAVEHALSALDLVNSLVNKTSPENLSQDDYSVLAIAFHNVAVERDHLKEYEKAAAAFQQGYQVAKRCLGEDHSLSITLGKNCDAVLQKSHKLSKGYTDVSPSTKTYFKEPLSNLDSRPILPSLTASQKLADTPPITSMSSSVQKDATAWMEEETQAWQQFAQSAFSMSSSGKVPLQPIQKTQSSKEQAVAPPSPKVSAHEQDLGLPALQGEATLSPSSGGPQLAGKSPLVQALNQHPTAMWDMLEPDMQGGSVIRVPNDFRPNRVVKGTTRTARVVRRTGMFNTTKHRDNFMTSKAERRGIGWQPKADYVQKAAAEKIQRVWRAWYKYCQENADWMTTTWICATMIQSRWRSYHVRRVKLDKAARTIQRHIRGFLVRKMLRQHRAAVTIQRHVIGMLTRIQLRQLHRAAVKMQSLIRGGQARKRVRQQRAFLTKVALRIQCAVRRMIAKRKVSQRRAHMNFIRGRICAAIDIQRYFRGFMGRRKAGLHQEQYMQELQRHLAATKLQAMVRRDQASKRVDNIRAQRLQKMDQAATFLRAMWLGAHTRKRYKALVKEFHNHEKYIVTIQRYGRGFLVRLRMWREAIRAEEELWAALEIQRMYRGYLGRVRWETALERVWRREMTAVVLQRNIRGWLARTRVNRARRKIARGEFERARRRFRAAQCIQAAARGMLARKVVTAKRKRCVTAAVCIQKITRGHALRVKLWQQVLDIRATVINAHVRGFLVRNRRFHVVAKSICIQRAVRKWQSKPREFRDQALEKMRERKAKAGKIQDAFRKHAEKKEIERIHKDATSS